MFIDWLNYYIIAKHSGMAPIKIVTRCYDWHRGTEIAHFWNHFDKNLGYTEIRCLLYLWKVVRWGKMEPSGSALFLCHCAFSQQVSNGNGCIHVARKEINVSYAMSQLLFRVLRVVTHKRPILRNQYRPRCTVRNFNTVIPRLKKTIRSGITFVSRNVISRRFL